MGMESLKRLLKRGVPVKWRREIRKRVLPLTVTHLHGPARVQLNSDEAIVTCVVKNGEFWMESFIEHYTRMGFRHIFFLDNGSTDQTIPIAKKHNNVSVCQSTLSIEANQGLYKGYLAERSAGEGWCVDADIDEFFDFPGSDVMELREFLQYLNRNQFTAVMTQLLDMFSDRPLSYLVQKQNEDLKAVYQYYDISDLERTPYRQAEFVQRNAYRNEVTNPSAELLFGGIRKTLYGSSWLTNLLLTKHSLFRLGVGLGLFPHLHFVNNAKLADVSCPMLHYKLTSNALEAALQNKETLPGIGRGYNDFIDFLLKHPDYHIKQHTAFRYEGAEALVEQGFLFAADQYRELVASHTGRTVAAG